MAIIEPQLGNIKSNRQPKKVEEILKKGITTTMIKNALQAGNTEVKQAQTDLLKNIILDDTILQLMMQEENLQKIKQRFEHRLIIHDKNMKVLIETGVFNKTPQQVITELQNKMKLQEEIKKGSPEVKRKLESIGYKNVQIHNDGQAEHYNIQIIFRKA